MQAAEQNAAEVEEELENLKNIELKNISADAAALSPEVMSEVEQAVEAWKARGGYCQTELLQPLAAQAIGISRYRLTTWLHQQGLKYTEWIAQLRVEEAKRIIAAHPDWSNDAVAQHCGFTDRTVLQRTSRKSRASRPRSIWRIWRPLVK